MRKWFHETVGGLPADFWVLWTGTLISRTGNLTILYLDINLVSRYHFSATLVGVVLGFAGGGTSAGVMVGGVLTDRLGRRSTLLGSNLAAGLSTLALALSTSAIPIIVFATAYGLASGAARPAASTLMIDVLAPAQRARGMNLNYWAMNIGFAAAATLSGLLAAQPQLIVFGIDAVATVAAAVLTFSLVRTSDPAAAAAATVERGGLGNVLRDRTFVVFVLLMTGMWTVIFCYCTLLPITMLHHHLPPNAFGSVLSVNGVIIVIGQLFVPRLLRDRSRTGALAFSSMLVAVGAGTVVFAPTVLALAATTGVWTLGEMLAVPGSSTLTAELSPAHLRGRYQGVASMTMLAGLVAPIVGGFVLDHGGDAALWIGCLVLGTGVAVGHRITGPARERKARLMTEITEIDLPEPALV